LARYRARRFGRLTRYVLAVSAAVAVAVPAAVVFADSAVSPQAGAAPHLDAIERTLRQVSPGLEGSVWERTSGNSLDAFGGDSAGWLLQTPGCWGDNTCADRSGTQRMLAKLTADISKATRTVDLSTLAPLPDGAFQDAIVAGLKAAAAKNKLKVRILVGAVPLGNLNVVPSSYRDELNRKLGSAAANVTLHIASMNTQKTAFSWNHSKILLVDGRSAIVGGTNFWSAEYIDTTHPVSDVSFALAGPAATSAGRYLDTLWAWTCQNSWNPVYVWFASSNRAGCPATMQRDANPPTAAPTGKLPVIAVGSLGVGIKSVDPASKYRPTLPTADARCPGGPRDNTNANRDFDTVNPEESALRALVESARSQIVLSQQDLNSTCPPMPRYDIRMYDILAAKLAAGVKVRIVLSDPANGGSFGSAGYSQIKSLTEITDILRDRLTVRTGNQQTARAAICGNLQLASFRSAPEARWADGKPYAKHHKVILVDRSTFYLGSRNVYPAWLQDFGYIVESPAAAAQLSTSLLDREWKYSQQTATVDHERGVCTA
jgi:phosphatidylserine/phosphatidylglycerophosphate/cardiolipin synthase-like enzyme